MSKGLLLAILLLLSIFGAFWYQEWQYLLPTPIPKNYHSPKPQQRIFLDSLVALDYTKPVFLHFFSPDCPCSQYNIAHFQELVAKYGAKVNFYAVVYTTASYNKQDFGEQYDLNIPVIVKNGTEIAEQCGVYSTPQAVILDKNKLLFYKGNYNKSRYCNNKNTKFAQTAIINLLQGKSCPDFGELSTKAYGCELPPNYYAPK
jgi:thiol-disulfide isomerase/thioredoxin